MSAQQYPIENVLLDRFVDGELSDREQRELLARLEEEPDGWRRLALAFTEGQLWGRELRVAVHSPPMPVARPTIAARRPWTSLLSLAAGLLLAVGVGTVVGRAWLPGRASQEHLVGRASLPSYTSPSPGQFLPQWSEQPTLTHGGQVGLVTLMPQDGTPIQLPVYDAAQVDSAQLPQRGSAVPREVLRALRSTGHEVKKQQRLWPIELNDGRQIVVPVEQVEIEFVGNRAFQ